jgi:hypothetical protein
MKIHYMEPRFNLTHSTVCGRLAETYPMFRCDPLPFVGRRRPAKVQDQPWRAVTCKRCLKYMTTHNIVLPAVPMVTRQNLMSGLEYQEPADTPNYCSPSSEAYWSM